MERMNSPHLSAFQEIVYWSNNGSVLKKQAGFSSLLAKLNSPHRVYVRLMDAPFRTTVEALTKIAAEQAAAKLSFSNP
jgi:hypothetical protein